jgi:hypothetical protein
VHLRLVHVTSVAWTLTYSSKYPWGSAHNLAPLILGIVLIIAFFVWELFAPYPMVPKALFSKAKRTMIVILLITFLSGGNYFVLLLLWPTQVYNVYGKSSLDYEGNILIS